MFRKTRLLWNMSKFDLNPVMGTAWVPHCTEWSSRFYWIFRPRDHLSSTNQEFSKSKMQKWKKVFQLVRLRSWSVPIDQHFLLTLLVTRTDDCFSLNLFKIVVVHLQTHFLSRSISIFSRFITSRQIQTDLLTVVRSFSKQTSGHWYFPTSITRDVIAWPIISQLQCLEIGRLTNSMQFRNVGQRILRFQDCEMFGRVLLLSFQCCLSSSPGARRRQS